ncbi:hypothetical protein C8R44DRAFT_733220 [Mycena epipterygia]|nr:hypothetical protein C8R44DRAFT_733220 [Mycena epipterygia]
MLESTRWGRAWRYPDRAERRDDTNRETTNPDLELVARLARQKGASTELTKGDPTYLSPTTLLESGKLIKTSQGDKHRTRRWPKGQGTRFELSGNGRVPASPLETKRLILTRGREYYQSFVAESTVSNVLHFQVGSIRGLQTPPALGAKIAAPNARESEEYNFKLRNIEQAETAVRETSEMINIEPRRRVLLTVSTSGLHANLNKNADRVRRAQRSRKVAESGGYEGDRRVRQNQKARRRKHG